MSRPAPRAGSDGGIESTVQLPEVALRVIAAHCNPFELLQASSVSKMWKRVFTSDAVWARHDVYQVGTGIHKHYLRVSETSTEIEFKCGPHEFASNSTNLYHVLARVRDAMPLERRVPPALTLNATRAFFELAALDMSRYSMSFENVPAWAQRDQQLVYALLRAGVFTGGLSRNYCSDRNAMLCINEQRALLPSPDNWSISVELLEDREVALHAVKVTGIVYTALSEELRSDREFFLAFMENVPAWFSTGGMLDDEDEAIRYRLSEDIPSSIKADRDLIIQALERYKAPQPLNFVPEKFASDWEVVSTALRLGPQARGDFPICCRFTNNISSDILQDRDQVLQVFGFGWVPSFDSMPLRLQVDKDILRSLVPVFQNRLVLYKLFEPICSQFLIVLRRLAAIFPFDVDNSEDYELVVRTLAHPRNMSVDKYHKGTRSRCKQRRLLFKNACMPYREMPEQCLRHQVRNCQSC